MAFNIVYSVHRWSVAPDDYKDWITSEHGDGPWEILALVPTGMNLPNLASLADQENVVTRDIPGGLVAAWPPLTA